MSAVGTRLSGRSRARRYERLDVIPGDSTLSFFATSSLCPVYGTSTTLNGTIEAAWNADGSLCLEPAPKMHVEFTVESLRTGKDLQDREMWKLIDSRRFPKIAADLHEVRTGTVPYALSAAGRITLAGLARTYEGELTARCDGDAVKIAGDLDVDVRDFGLKPITLLVLSVAPLVRVRLRLVASVGGSSCV